MQGSSKALPEIVLSGAVDAPVKAAAPSLLEPVAGAVMSNAKPDDDKAAVWEFQWSAVPGADRVPSSSSISPTRRRPRSMMRHIASTSYRADRKRRSFPRAVASGWKWRVRAIVKDQWTDWSEERSFEVAPAVRIVTRPAIPAAGVLAPLRELLEQQWPKDDSSHGSNWPSRHTRFAWRENPATSRRSSTVLLEDAVGRAGRQGDCLLGVLAVQELSKRFGTPKSERMLEAVKLAASHARRIGGHGNRHGDHVQNQAEKARSEDEFAAWCEIARDLEGPTSKLLLEQAQPGIAGPCASRGKPKRRACRPSN